MDKKKIYISGVLLIAALAVCGVCISPVIERARTNEISDRQMKQSAADHLNARFLEAVRDGNMAMVEALLKEGADINAQDEFGQSALHFVERADIADVLIQNGADVELRDHELEMTPVFVQNAQVLQLLLEEGARINNRSRDGNTPLMWHVYSGHLEGVRLLLERGADMNLKNIDGHTALDIAERFSCQDIIGYLISLDARHGEDF